VDFLRVFLCIAQNTRKWGTFKMVDLLQDESEENTVTEDDNLQDEDAASDDQEKSSEEDDTEDEDPDISGDDVVKLNKRIKIFCYERLEKYDSGQSLPCPG